MRITNFFERFHGRWLCFMAKNAVRMAEQGDQPAYDNLLRIGTVIAAWVPTQAPEHRPIGNCTRFTEPLHMVAAKLAESRFLIEDAGGLLLLAAACMQPESPWESQIITTWEHMAARMGYGLEIQYMHTTVKMLSEESVLGRHAAQKLASQTTARVKDAPLTPSPPR